MVDHYPEDNMPEPEAPEQTAEQEAERDPDRCKVTPSHSVTRWLDYFFNFRLLTTLKICPIA